MMMRSIYILILIALVSCKEKDKSKEWNIEKLSFLKRKKKGNCWKFKKMLLKQHKVIILMSKIQILRGKGRKSKNNLRNNKKC